MVDKTLKRDFEYKLEGQISLMKGGEKLFTNKVLLKAPSIAQMSDRCVIKTAIMECLDKQTKKSDGATPVGAPEDSKDEVSFAEQMTSVLYMNSQRDDMERVLGAFVNILSSSATVETETMRQNIINQLDGNDLDGMLGEYIANFIIPSWMKRAMKS